METFDKMIKKYITIPIWLFILAVIFAAGFYTNTLLRPSIEKVEGLDNKQVGQPEKVDFSLFWDAWSVIEEKYVDREKVDRQKMVYGAIAGLIESLDDPYSVFMEPQESKKFVDDMSGSFEGIGAEVGIRKGILTIISPLQGNPAEKAGLRAGDQILKIEDTLTNDLTLDEAVSLIRGEKGTTVKLLVFRNSWEENKEIEIIRGKIEIPIIEWKMISAAEEGEKNIAYIQFNHFTQNATSEFKKIVSQIIQQEPKGLVLDIRNNPGGYLEVAVDISSWFVPKGDLVVIEDFGNGEKNEYRSKGYEGLEEIPTVILINCGSASASEILAGATRSIEKIKIVGEKSFGKGSVQQLKEMKDDSSIKITIAKWLTPLGESISEKGIVPDIEVEITEEDIDNMIDPQLDKALEMLKE